MRPCASDCLRERSRRVSGAAVEDGEVEISRIAVLADVHEPKCSPTLEDETAAVRHLNLRQLSDHVGQDVVALHDRRIDPSSSARRVIRWWVITGQLLTTDRSSSTSTFHATR
jgi:hypothetical protein